MIKKLKVAVLSGGKSPEHQISLISGEEVIKNLNRHRYEVSSIIVSKGGKSFKLNEKKYPLGQLSIAFRQKTILNCQLFFIAMHGPYGEDGTIQGLLELVGIPYTGSGVLASALGMDKISSRKLFTQAGLTVPKSEVFEKGKGKKPAIKPPLFIKPSNQGSSVGASIVHNLIELPKALNLAWRYSRFAVVDEFIKGTEVTAAILGNDNPKALPLVEIATKREFFDFEAKYNERLTDEIVPARISKSLTKKAQDAALLAYQTLGCRGFARVDMIIRSGRVYVLEVNTIPGLTSISLFPKAAKAAGISYPQLLDKIITLALEK